MHETARLAKANGVAIGAHPGFRDLWGFGRRPIMGERPEDVEKEILYQTGALQALAAAAGHEVTHLKPHGSLGNIRSDERSEGTERVRTCPSRWAPDHYKKHTQHNTYLRTPP